MRTILCGLVALALIACGDGKADAVNDRESIDAASGRTKVVDLAAYDLPFTVMFPDQRSLTDTVPTLGWNEEQGWFGAKLGERFNLRIIEGPADLGRLKRDLDNDLLRTHTLITDQSDLVIYRSEYPDDPSLVFIHFFQVVAHDGRQFVIESDPEGQFNEADIRQMVEAVKAKIPA